MIEVIARYFLYFIIYAFMGWLLEEIWHLIKLRKIVDRGFLIGPLCPIYGWGCVLIIILIGRNTTDALAVFLKAIVVCSILEYLTSYIMEKLFHARWWDYSDSRFNLNGRICLDTMIPFGILGCFVVYILHPFVMGIVNILTMPWFYVVAGTIFIIYIIDNIISLNVMFNIKGQIHLELKDSTEEMNEHVREWIKSKSLIYRRINGAYPNFKINKYIINKIKEHKSKTK
ncbi:MAG: putative ABC transporter permease [Bacilli bacterium]|nr:putative ABC transporter permease [Bacilli bacterium]